jgi:hypothetical protein
MESLYSIGALLPLWILGASLLVAVISLVTMPKAGSRSDQRDSRVMPARSTALGV